MNSTQSISTSFTLAATITTNTTQYETELAIFEAINITLLTLTSWLLFSLIIYGIKTGRFVKKAQSSSLSNGRIYIACIVGITCLFPRLIVTQISHQSRRSGNQNCRLIGLVATGGYGLSIYGIYAFLWFRQRVIFAHPFVRDKVSGTMNWLSRLYILILTAVAVSLTTYFMVTKAKSFEKQNYGCSEKRPRLTNYVLAAAYVTVQALLLFLCIYPTTRVNIQQSQDNSESPQSARNDVDKTLGYSWSGFTRFIRAVCSTDVKSPVETVMKKTVISSVVIVITDIAVVISESVVLDRFAPIDVRQTVVDISTCLNAFCIVATFGFAINVFTLFCPTCQIRRKRRSTADSVNIVYDNSLIEENV